MIVIYLWEFRVLKGVTIRCHSCSEPPATSRVSIFAI